VHTLGATIETLVCATTQLSLLVCVTVQTRYDDVCDLLDEVLKVSVV
jgi:hypothetical protein